MRRPGPPPTLGELQRQRCGGWVWLYCATPNCSHKRPVALAPFVIRWGPDASSDQLRRSARCIACGGRGATLMSPSWKDMQVGHAPFPAHLLSPLDRAMWAPPPKGSGR